MRSRLLIGLGFITLLASVGATTVAAQGERASQPPKEERAQKLLRSDAIDTALETGPATSAGRHPDQHGRSNGHLPPLRKNVKLVSRLRLTDTPGGIADVHYYKGFAYLAAWAPECPNGGIHVVDVRDPQNPRKVGFIPAGEHEDRLRAVTPAHVHTLAKRIFHSGNLTAAFVGPAPAKEDIAKMLTLP